jgi:hypothetical protein
MLNKYTLYMNWKKTVKIIILEQICIVKKLKILNRDGLNILDS